MANRNANKGTGHDKKFIAGIIITTIAVIALVAALLFVNWYQNRTTFVDKNGWLHTDEGGLYDTDPYASLQYAVISVDKADYTDITSHQFLSKLKPVFKAYSSKSYITLDFGDGTGLYWPFADKQYDGIYGEIDESGHITSQEKIIHVEGNQVTSTDAKAETSKESVDMASLLPIEYFSDNTLVVVMQDVLYLNVYFDASAQTYADVANELWSIYKDADLSAINTVLIRMNDEVFYEVDINAAEPSPVYVENGYAKWESFLYEDAPSNSVPAQESVTESTEATDIGEDTTSSMFDAYTEE